MSGQEHTGFGKGSISDFPNALIGASIQNACSAADRVTDDNKKMAAADKAANETMNSVHDTIRHVGNSGFAALLMMGANNPDMYVQCTNCGLKLPMGTKCKKTRLYH